MKFLLDTGELRCYTHSRKAKALWSDPERFFLCRRNNCAHGLNRICRKDAMQWGIPAGKVPASLFCGRIGGFHKDRRRKITYFAGQPYPGREKNGYWHLRLHVWRMARALCGIRDLWVFAVEDEEEIL